MAWEYLNYDYDTVKTFHKILVWSDKNFNCYFALKKESTDSWNYYAGTSGHALSTGLKLTDYAASETNAQTNYLTTTQDSNGKTLAVLPTTFDARYVRIYIETGDNVTIHEFRPSIYFLANEIVAGELEITASLSDAPRIVVKKNGSEKVVFGNIDSSQSGAYGVAGYDSNGATIFELSDSNQHIASWNFTASQLTKNDTIISSQGRIKLGSGSNVINIDSQNATYRIWAGVHATPASAPFRVTKEGKLYADGAEVSGTIIGSALQASSVTSRELQTDTIESYNINASAVTAVEIAAGTIKAVNMEASSISAREIQTNTIESYNIVASAITSVEIAANTIIATNIQTRTITASEMVLQTITYEEIKNRTITATNLSVNCITASEIRGSNFGELTISSGKIIANSANAFEINTASGLYINNGANIVCASGGDLILSGNDSDNYSQIIFESGVDFTFGANIQDTFCVWPSTIGSGNMYFGYKINGGSNTSYEFDTFRVRAETEIDHLCGDNTATPFANITQDVSTGAQESTIGLSTTYSNDASLSTRILMKSDELHTLSYIRLKTGNTENLELDKDGKLWLYAGPIEIDVASGDPTIIFDTQGADKFTIGVDDSDSDLFKICAGGSLVAGDDFIAIDNSGKRIGINIDPDASLHIAEQGADANFYLDNYSTTNSDYPLISLLKSDSDTIGTLTETDTGDYLGAIVFYGVDSSSTIGPGGVIIVEQTAAAGASYIPTTLRMASYSSTGSNTGILMTSNGNVGLNVTPPANCKFGIALSTENLEIIDAGSAAATEQDWIEVEVGGNQGYIRVFAGK